MCRPSTVTDDWVVKGCHIHVDGIELAVRPTHSADYLDGILFKRVFQSTSGEAFQAAAKRARQECLVDAKIRESWRQALRRGMEFVRSYQGELAELANGRQLEFVRLIRFLNKYDKRHADT
jgi:hypothetical protein